MYTYDVWTLLATWLAIYIVVGGQLNQVIGRYQDIE